MSTLERTRQQLDPVGSLGSRPISILFVLGSFVYAVVTTLVSRDQISNGAIAVMALLWLLAACLVIIVGTSSRRAPFTHNAHIMVHLLALGSIALSVASQWGTNQAVQDDFGPASLAMLLFAIGPYRPAPEIAGAGSLSAIFVGFVTLLEVPVFESTTPPVTFVLASVAPLLAATFASATFSGSLVSSLERWRATALNLAASRNHQLMDGIARSVQQDRVTVLGRDVLPFFSEILDRGTVTDVDRERAREIADSIRSIMVAEANRSWLEVLVSGTFGAQRGVTIDDPSGCASMMAAEQRTAVRAILQTLTEEESFHSDSLKIELHRVGDLCRGLVTAGVSGAEFPFRSRFLPYVALLRVVFADVQVDFKQSLLTLEFSYDQR